MTYVVAAGNMSGNACYESPSSTPNAITVGATDSTDAMYVLSNYGPCVKIFAPGVNITSAWDSSYTADSVETGTSMASPHVAGAAAMYLQMHPSATPAAVAAFLTDSATLNVITGIGPNSPNKLLYTAPFPVLHVTMSGPSLVRPNQSCGWWANPTGGRPPYNYSWFPSDSGGDPDPNEVIESFASSDTLRVTVTDSTSQQASAKMYITVSSSAPRMCPYGPVQR